MKIDDLIKSLKEIREHEGNCEVTISVNGFGGYVVYFVEAVTTSFLSEDSFENTTPPEGMFSEEILKVPIAEITTGTMIYAT